MLIIDIVRLHTYVQHALTAVASFSFLSTPGASVKTSLTIEQDSRGDLNDLNDLNTANSFLVPSR